MGKGLEEMVRGKLIVIDGADGSGKTEQTKRLVARLEEEGYNVKTVSFPRYGEPAAEDVARYLRGDFGPMDQLDPKVVSDYFAFDRADFAPTLRRWLAEGYIVVSNRYTTSNVGHQSIKYPTTEEQDGYINWLFDREYEELGIPRPDATIVCHVPYDVAVENIRKKDASRQDRNYLHGAKADIHEKDSSHLHKAIEAYRRSAERLPGWYLVECCIEGDNKPYEEIHEQIWDIVNKIIR
jgi:dTMP kinase